MRRVVITKEIMAFAHENDEIMVDQVQSKAAIHGSCVPI